MQKKKDLSNVAYSQEYLKYRNERISSVLSPENKTKEVIREESGYTRIIISYQKERYICSENKVYNMNKDLIHEYINLYQHPFFCTPIQYSNGKMYLFYKEELYGYSVFDMESKEVFRYIPQESFSGGETFIATDIYYNATHDLIAAEGCYWACPVDTFLLRIEDPMKQFDKYLNFHELLDSDYEKYDDICFSSWSENGIDLKCYNILSEPCKDELVQITESDYLKALKVK